MPMAVGMKGIGRMTLPVALENVTPRTLTMKVNGMMVCSMDKGSKGQKMEQHI